MYTTCSPQVWASIHSSKEMLNACPVLPMHIIVRLLPGRQSCVLSSNEWHNDMNPAFISAVMAPHIKITEITTGAGIDQYGYIAPAFSGSPWCGEKRDGKWVKMVEKG